MDATLVVSHPYSFGAMHRIEGFPSLHLRLPLLHVPCCPTCKVVPDVVPRVLHLCVVAAGAGLEQCHHPEPVAQALAQADGQVAPVHVQVHLLGLVEAVEPRGDLGLGDNFKGQ